MNYHRETGQVEYRSKDGKETKVIDALEWPRQRAVGYKRTLAVSDQIAIYAMVVDAINDNAKGFYEQFGFTRLSDDSSTRN